jgi:hypothetical protein
MRIKQTVVPAITLIMFSIGLPAIASGSETSPNISSYGQPYFIGCNVLSPFPSFLPVPGNTIFSVLSNLECGLGVSGGMVIDRSHALELRLALGPNSRSETIFNMQAYYNFFLMRHLGWRMKGLYTGSGIRYWDLFNGLTDIHRNNVAGEIDLGYRFGVRGPFYIDLRASEIAAVYSWLSAEHTVGGWATLADKSLPKVPLLSVDLGFTF